MRKGRGLLTTAGVLNIIFGLGLIAIVAMFFLYSEPFEIALTFLAVFAATFFKYFLLNQY